MATIVPAYSNSSVPLVSGTSAHIAVVENSPSWLVQQAIGTVVDAEVLILSASGSVEVQTSLGKLLITSGLDLTEGDKLQLKLQKLLPQPQFLIRTNTNEDIQGKSLNHGASVKLNSDKVPDLVNSTRSNSLKPNRNVQSNPLATDLKGTLPSVPVGKPINLEVDAVIKATIFKLPSAQLTTANQQSSQINVTVRPNSSEVRNGDITNNKFSMLHGITPQAVSITAQHGAMSFLSLGSQFEVRIWSLMPSKFPGLGHDATKGTPLGQIYQGHVISTNASGRPIVETPIGQLILNTNSQIQIGAELLLEVIPNTGATYTEPIGDHPLTSIFAAGDWPTLTEALNAIQSSDIASNRQAMEILVPKVGSQLASKLLFFISALKGGNINSWLGGEATTLLQHTLPELSARLNEEFVQLARSFNEAPTGDWRTALIPLLNGSHLGFFQMSFRGGSKDTNKEFEEDASRFIIDVKLSNLGQIQLDGLIKSKGQHFDLFVRSKKPFAKSMRRDLSNIFFESIDLMGISGNLVFQTDARFIEIPHPKFAPHDGVGLVV